MKRQLATLVVALAGGAAIAAGAPAAAADTEPSSGSVPIEVGKAPAKWSVNKSFGATKGKATTTKARGAVKDKKADGDCARVYLYWIKNDKVRDIDRTTVCGSGKTKAVKKKAGDSKPFKADKLGIKLVRA